MPDLFLTKTSGTASFYELYIQRSVNKKQMYCLVQTDNFADLGGDSATTVPLIDFADLDRDAMPDMAFYSDSAVYTFYN